MKRVIVAIGIMFAASSAYADESIFTRSTDENLFNTVDKCEIFKSSVPSIEAMEFCSMAAQELMNRHSVDVLTEMRAKRDMRLESLIESFPQGTLTVEDKLDIYLAPRTEL